MGAMKKLKNYAMYVFVLGLVSFTLIILACGGDDVPAPIPAQAPTPTQSFFGTQAPTATIESGFDGNGGSSVDVSPTPTETPTDTPTDTTTGRMTSSGDASMFLSANTSDTVRVELDAGDVLEVIFEVESNIVGGQSGVNAEGKAIAGIQLVVFDSLDSPIFSIEEITVSGTVKLQAEITGTHSIVFFNPFPLQAQSVEVDYTVSH